MPAAVQLNVQLVVPVAGFHVAPPSVETSTPTTMPPPVSMAVPVIVTGVPAANDAPFAGDVIADVGASASVEAVAATRPDCSVAGLHAHVGEQVDRRLSHADVGGGDAAIVIRIQAPRPLHGAGAEHERAAARLGTSVSACVTVPLPYVDP